jgi:hypothetical protein
VTLDDARFCPSCGAPLPVVNPPGQSSPSLGSVPAAAPASNPQPGGNGNGVTHDASDGAPAAQPGEVTVPASSQRPPPPVGYVAPVPPPPVPGPTPPPPQPGPWPPATTPAYPEPGPTATDNTVVAMFGTATATLPDQSTGSPAAPPPAAAQPGPTKPVRLTDRREHALAALVAVAGAVLAVAGTFDTWLRILIGGEVGTGGSSTGWAGQDGRTVLVTGVVTGVVALGLLLGRRDGWLKSALLVSGAVDVVVAVANMVSAGSKAHDIQVQFGIPSDQISAEIGLGLWLVLIGGLAQLLAGLLARREV